jgi:hypothetical protein
MKRSASTVALAAIILAISAGWMPFAHAIYIRHDVQPIGSPGVGLDDYSIQNLANGYPTVGYLWTGNAAAGQQHCTATIVSGAGSFTRIITAAHCLFPYDTHPNRGIASPGAKYLDPTEAALLTFSLGTPLGNMVGPGVPIVQGWYQGNYVGGVSQWDVGVLEVRASLAALGGVVAPLSFAAPATWLGRQATFLGFGIQGEGADSPDLDVVANGFNPTNLRYTDPVTQGTFFASDKLAGQNIVDLYSSDNLIVTDFDRFDGAGANPLGNRFGLNFEATAAPGDSGGPLFPVNVAGLVGVASGIGGVAAGCTKGSAYDGCSAWAPLFVNAAFVRATIPTTATSWLVLGALAAMFWAVTRRRTRWSST